MAVPELSPEQRARIEQGSAWIQKTQSESPDQLLSRLRKYERDFLAEIEGLSEEQFRWKPSETEWSVQEVCLHVANATRTVAELIPSLADGVTPPPNPNARLGVLDPDPGDTAKVREGVRQAFQIAADATGTLEGVPDLETRVPHPFFGQLNCREWAVFNLMHAAVHIRQVQRVKNTEGFPG